MNGADAASLRFWELIADIGTWLVIIGVGGEVIEIALKISEHKIKNERFQGWYKRHQLSIELFAGLFWMFVIVGLLIEHRGNQKTQIIVKSENSRITKEAGEAIKSAGEANERAAKFELAAATLQKQISETTNKIAKIEPLNQPVWDISAIVQLTVTGREFPTNGITRIGSLMLCEGDLSRTVLPKMALATLEAVYWTPEANKRTYAARFDLDVTATSLWPFEQPSNPITNINFARIDAGFLPTNCEVISGFVRVVVNDSVVRWFRVLPQIPPLFALDEVVIVATNVPYKPNDPSWLK